MPGLNLLTQDSQKEDNLSKGTDFYSEFLLKIKESVQGVKTKDTFPLFSIKYLNYFAGCRKKVFSIIEY